MVVFTEVVGLVHFASQLTLFPSTYTYTAIISISSPSTSNDAPTAHSVWINAKLVVVETVPTNKNNKKALTKKIIKNKQFTHQFKASKDNYVELLNTFLKTHHIQEYHAMASHTFIFKIQVPPAKYDQSVISVLADSSLGLGKLAQVQKHRKVHDIVFSPK